MSTQRSNPNSIYKPACHTGSLAQHFVKCIYALKVSHNQYLRKTGGGGVAGSEPLGIADSDLRRDWPLPDARLTHQAQLLSGFPGTRQQDTTRVVH
jgi:hypothetical protein